MRGTSSTWRWHHHRRGLRTIIERWYPSPDAADRTLLGNVDFSNSSSCSRKGRSPALRDGRCGQGAGAVTLNYGLFVNTVVNFLIVAFAIFS